MTKQKECVHHWMIDTASGRESAGKCKKCKLEKVFHNSIEAQDIRGGWTVSLHLGKQSIKGE